MGYRDQILVHWDMRTSRNKARDMIASGDILVHWDMRTSRNVFRVLLLTTQNSSSLGYAH